jgi:hypothetical protein
MTTGIITMVYVGIVQCLACLLLKFLPSEYIDICWK